MRARPSPWLIVLIAALWQPTGVGAQGEGWIQQDGPIYRCMDMSGKNQASYRRCDGPKLVYLEGFHLQSALSENNFSGIETSYARWCNGKERLPDGTWKLESIRASISPMFLTWKRWDVDEKRFESWRASSPGSLAEALTEAMFWQEYGRFAEYSNVAGNVNPEVERIADERYTKGLERLQAVRDQRDSCALWYPMMIAALVDLERPEEEIRTVYDEAVKAHPDYFPIYFEMARAFLPLRGKSARSYEHFALEATQSTRALLGGGMYALLYAYRDRAKFTAPTQILPGHPVSWPRLDTGFADLRKRYPNSPYILNLWASFACRAGDRDAYRKARTAMGSDVFQEVWVTGFGVEVCDTRFGVDADAL